MASQVSRDEMRRFARLGAMKRLEELRREESAIRSAFPELFRGRTRPLTTESAASAAPRGRKPYKMSPEAKRAVSERMKKYWAARRKAKG